MAEYIVDYSGIADDEVEKHARECINIHERIVRCKDCRYYEELEDVIDVSLLDGLNEIKLKEVSKLCTYWATDHVTKPNWFCALGKPKEASRWKS